MLLNSTFKASVLFLLLIVVPIMGSTAAVKQCGAILNDGQKAIKTIGKVDSKVRVWLDWVFPSAKKDIDDFVENHNGARFVNRFMDFETSVAIGDKTFRTTTYLGAGGGGAVFLVKSVATGELFVAKVTSNEYSYRYHIEAHLMDTSLPKLIAADPAHFVVLLEYKEGIPVYDIENNGQKFGFSKGEIKNILKRFDRLKFSDNGKHNIIYSPAANRFYLIDPS
jgi:hypothetical protein